MFISQSVGVLQLVYFPMCWCAAACLFPNVLVCCSVFISQSVGVLQLVYFPMCLVLQLVYFPMCWGAAAC